MALTLTTHDTRFDQLDDATIAKVLASLDGGRNVLATLERSELTYLQAEGGVREGFVLEYQDGSLDQRFRSRDHALPLAQVTEIFQTYARGEDDLARGPRVGARAVHPARDPVVQHVVGVHRGDLRGGRPHLVVARLARRRIHREELTTPALSNTRIERRRPGRLRPRGPGASCSAGELRRASRQGSYHFTTIALAACRPRARLRPGVDRAAAGADHARRRVRARA